MVPTTEVSEESDISNADDNVDNDDNDDTTDDIGRVNIQYSPENNNQAETNST